MEIVALRRYNSHNDSVRQNTPDYGGCVRALSIPCKKLVHALTPPLHRYLVFSGCQDTRTCFIFSIKWSVLEATTYGLPPVSVGVRDIRVLFRRYLRV